MGGATIVEILLSVLVVAVSVATYLGAARAGKNQAAGAVADVEAKAYQRAEVIYQDAIDTLVKHVERLKDQSETLEMEVNKLHRSNSDLLEQVSSLRIAIVKYQAQLAKLDIT